MAGGPNAAAVMCPRCCGKATRTCEGVEDDHYLCEQCGREFGLDWRRGQPERPCWPPSPKELEMGKRVAAALGGRPVSAGSKRKWWQFWK